MLLETLDDTLYLSGVGGLEVFADFIQDGDSFCPLLLGGHLFKIPQFLHYVNDYSFIGDLLRKALQCFQNLADTGLSHLYLV